MTTSESTQLFAHGDELFDALAAHAITFPSREAANAAGFVMNDSSLGSCGKGNHGVVLYYHDLMGERLDFHRIRYTTPLHNPARPDRPVKYRQPYNSVPHAYFPKIPGMNWSVIGLDAAQPIIITEGEYKAYSASLNLGIPTIGLGGVNSYKSKEQSADPNGLLSELGGIQWDHRIVYICYDSDAESNDNVGNAQLSLARALTALGAVPYVVALPSADDGSKQGLDDYIMACGAEATKAVLQLAIPNQEAEALHKFAKLCYYIRESQSFAAADIRALVDLSKASRTVFGTHSLRQHRIVNGKRVAKDVQTFDAYQKWPARAELDRADVGVGLPAIYTDYRGKSVFNIWKDSHPAPVEGDVQPYLDLVNYVLQRSPDLIPYWHDWVSTIVRTNAKMPTAWLLIDPATGTGKTMLAKLVGHLFGPSGHKELTEALFDSPKEFNRELVGQQIIVVDELSHKRIDKDVAWLKNIVTRHTFVYDQKYTAAFDVTDCANYIFTSNEDTAVRLEDTDRRFFYVPAPKEKLPQSIIDALSVAGFIPDQTKPHVPPVNIGVIRNWYLNHYEQSPGWRLDTKPPHNEARANAIEATRSDIESWVRALEAGDHAYNAATVFAVHDLCKLALDEGVALKTVTSVYMANLLKKCRVEPIAIDVNVHTDRGRRKVKLYAFGNHGIQSAYQARQVYEAEAAARLNLLSGVQGNMKF